MRGRWPYYPKRSNGRPPTGLERILRIHFMQNWFKLADLACEEALYDSASLRHFAGINPRCEAAVRYREAWPRMRAAH